jgi:putative two-component system response regulator
VCDVYDALCTRRPYRDAWPAAKAASYLTERAAVEFDPNLVSALTRMLDQANVQLGIAGEERPSSV